MLAPAARSGDGGAIDGVDGHRGNSQFFRGFDDTRATAALVFHLVA